MTNHIHMILNCNEPFKLKDTVRDFKKYTSKSIVNEISNGIESRKEWLLAAFARAAKDSTKNKTYKVWKPGNHAIELWQEKFTWDKIKYIHQNPVKAGFVKSIEDWFYSSASNYMDMENNALEEVSCVSVPFKTIK